MIVQRRDNLGDGALRKELCAVQVRFLRDFEQCVKLEVELWRKHDSPPLGFSHVNAHTVGDICTHVSVDV